jgi:hypothetical protein
MGLCGCNDRQDIIQWVKKKSGPPAKTISDADELKALLNTASPVVIASFASYKVGLAHKCEAVWHHSLFCRIFYCQNIGRKSLSAKVWNTYVTVVE